ncbi:unnamed protein product [Clonostachys rhizophaga]|uniref:Zn(2)-C6 fungal-type domain-containing protein n=1 Tax=Clonostachys rhizophaga TaxID=160324 RepID=A0A9N9V891_9HYPO|nr:unnamed protein product [Clonostachys rhizophaga]
MATAQRSGTEKLRSSCDRCTALKIRCDKQTPTCGRCRAPGLACVYSPYRWKGRPSSNRSRRLEGQGAPAEPASQPTRVAEEEPSSSPVSRGGATQPQPGTEHSYPEYMELSSPGVGRGQFPPTAEFSFEHSLEIGLLNLDVPARDTFPHALMPVSQTEPSSLYSPTRVENVTQPSYPVGETTGTVGWGHESESGIHSLTTPSMASAITRAEGGDLNSGLGLPVESVSTDQALKVNRGALQTLNQIGSRNCNNCAADANMNLLLHTTCHRMLSIYRSIFQCIADKNHMSTDRHQNGLEPPYLPHFNSGGLYFSPVQFNEFRVDMLTARRLNSQLLNYELETLKRLVKTLGNPRHSLGSAESRADASTQGRPVNSATATSYQEVLRQLLANSIDELIAEIRQFCQM